MAKHTFGEIAGYPEGSVFVSRKDLNAAEFTGRRRQVFRAGRWKARIQSFYREDMKMMRTTVMKSSIRDRVDATQLPRTGC
jgi:hypothetical protein